MLLFSTFNLRSQDHPGIQLIYSTYYGGNQSENGIGLTIDASENIYVTGFTSSSNFPVSAGAFQTNYAGDTDCYLIKLNSSGQRIWATYIGGSGFEIGRDISVDPSGNIIICGITSSQNFPVTANAFQTYYAGVQDVFIMKFNSNGQRVWSTYLGGSLIDQGFGLKTDNSGNIIISGMTTSTNFPSSPNSFQTQLAGGQDAFIAKFNSNGQRLWITYLGGLMDDISDDVAIDLFDNILILGSTLSLNFPVTTGSYQYNNAGLSDAFVAKFSNAGQRKWCSYYGGTQYDYGFGGVATDKKGNIIFGGWTNSTNFPVIANSFQASNGGAYDAFVVKFDSIGNRTWASYFGGAANDKGESISIDTSNNIFITGYTESLNLPITSNTYQNINQGKMDGFISKFNENGNRIWGTYFGGIENDYCHISTSAINGNVLISGMTLSDNFPVTQNAFQNQKSNYSDIFVSILSGNPIGIKPVSNEIPESFELYPNYPNPFNPSTTIRFSIPPSRGARGVTNVKLIIYDMLGREIVELVNEEKKSGTYEVSWDGSSFASGLYFYRIITDEFSETKRMVLLK